MAEYIDKADIIKLINDCMFDLSDSDDLTRMLTEVEELSTITIDHIAEGSKKVVNGKDTVYRQDVIDQVVTAVRKIILDPAPVDFKMSTEYMYLNIYNVIYGVPSAQPDIIRCGDCKWYGRADKRRFYRGMDCLQKRIDTIVPDRDFCSKAERRTE